MSAERTLDDDASSGVAIHNVSKSFRTGRDVAIALDDVSLNVERGKFVTLIGPSGCGKSTLLRILAGLTQTDAGAVSLFGEAVDVARIHKRIGLVAQTPALLPWRTVLENVELPLEVNRNAGGGALADSADPRELLGAFGLADALDKRPAQLSGGMQQRVAIARAFAFRPSLLLMDEPFSALDELTREVLRNELLEVWQRFTTTVVFVTHSVTEAALLSDTVVVMSGAPGRIAAELAVPFERPRREGIELSEQFRTFEADLRDILRAGWHHGGN